MPSPWKRRGLQLLGFVLVVLFLVATRATLASQSELERGNQMLEAGDDEGALQHWRRAAKWHVPASPFGPRAIEQLEALAERRASAGDSAGALEAWRAVRGSALAARSFYIPYGDAGERADEAIHAITRGERASASLDLRGEAVGPLFFLAVFAFWAFVLSLWLLAARGIDEEDRVTPAAKLWSFCAVSSLAGLIVALLMA